MSLAFAAFLTSRADCFFLEESRVVGGLEQYFVVASQEGDANQGQAQLALLRRDGDIGNLSPEDSEVLTTKLLQLF